MFLLGAAIKKAVQNQGRNVKMIYDSHEFLSGYPLYQSIDRKLDRLKGKLVWNWFVLQERKNIGKADYVISVSQSICDELERKFSLANPSVLLRNIPKIQGIEKSGKKYFHEKYGLSPEDKVIIHTGNAFFSLDRLALLVRLVREHSEAYIVFLGSRKSIDRFKPYVKKMQVENKIFFHSKVAKDEVTRYCSMADIGLVFVWKPQWISYWFSFPNKLFDVSLAGLPSLATAQPEFERFNREHGHMVTFDGNSYEALNKAYNHLLNTYEELKKNALKIRDSISWEYEAKKLDVIYQSILHDKQDHS